MTEQQREWSWRREFPDYPADTMPEIPAGWEDSSWHNDAMPFFIASPTLGIWVDWADPAQSDFPEWRADGRMKRFMVTPLVDGQHPEDQLATLLETDDWAAVLAFVAERAS